MSLAEKMARDRCEGTYTPLGGLTKKGYNARIRYSVLLDLIRRVHLCQHGLAQSVSEGTSVVSARCSH